MRYLKAFFPHFTYCIRNTALSHRRSAGRDWGFYFLTFGLWHSRRSNSRLIVRLLMLPPLLPLRKLKQSKQMCSKVWPSLREIPMNPALLWFFLPEIQFVRAGSSSILLTVIAEYAFPSIGGVPNWRKRSIVEFTTKRATLANPDLTRCWLRLLERRLSSYSVQTLLGHLNLLLYLHLLCDKEKCRIVRPVQTLPRGLFVAFFGSSVAHRDCLKIGKKIKVENYWWPKNQIASPSRIRIGCAQSASFGQRKTDLPDPVKKWNHGTRQLGPW
jgi:hypothetical protein